MVPQHSEEDQTFVQELRLLLPYLASVTRDVAPPARGCVVSVTPARGGRRNLQFLRFPAVRKFQKTTWTVGELCSPTGGWKAMHVPAPLWSEAVFRPAQP